MSASAPVVTATTDARNGRRRRFDVRKDGRRVAIALALLLGLDLVAWYAFVRPVQAEIAELRRDEENAGQARARSLDRLTRLRQTRDHVTGVQDGVRSFYEEMLATRGERSVLFQRAIGAVSTEFGVRPQQASITFTEMPQEGIEVMNLNFPIEGGYENLRRFLARLESLDQFLIVREVALQGSDEGGRRLRLSVVLETAFSDPTMREEQARMKEWEKKVRDRRRQQPRARR